MSRHLYVIEYIAQYIHRLCLETALVIKLNHSRFNVQQSIGPKALNAHSPIFVQLPVAEHCAWKMECSNEIILY